ncbi:SOS response UmuD protein. Serine peptidase. MEROPS family S24 [Chitinophaga sp. YR573]|uniref:LexA family protein n=1 Tax=Chitinophaga sp. YR573 TaxID=1881040 RepID=UPI0008CAB456|nr:S24 family peptidase [Chitinophaga sp. YR573]SEW21152.1 SOS response UmuD protein. Serine peptidase. MEROPS family S24 [Chitinophaga sp. YR573]
MKEGGKSDNHPAYNIQHLSVILQIIDARVSAGFPSPAADHSENEIDLIKEFGLDKPSVFIMQVDGTSMQGERIFIPNGAYICVDRAPKARPGNVVIAILNGEFTVKTLLRKNGRWILHPENPAFSPIEVGQEDELTIWGVAKAVIFRL